MARLITCDESSLSKETLEILEPTRINGKLADVYLQFANSEPALAAYMSMEQKLREGSLPEHELEAIKLLVSQLTECDYCLAVHTMKARKAGFDKETQLAIRSGSDTGNPRINTILEIVRHFFEKKGPLPESLIDSARAQGLVDAELVDITMAVSTIFFTNITNHINHTQATLPAAPPLNPN